MATKHQKIKINLDGYSPEEREAILVKVIDRIVERTQSGKDKNGERFAPYSKEYKNSSSFKIAGKNSTVDLTLSGDMLDSIKILKNAPVAEVGFERGSNENGKADGNIRGTYGKDKPVGPKRDFLGISQKELRQILQDFPKGTEESFRNAERTLSKVKNSEILSGKVNLEDLE